MTYPPVEPGQRPHHDERNEMRLDDDDRAAWHRGAWIAWSLLIAVAVIAGAMLFWARDTNDTRSAQTTPPATTGSAPER